jgi:hypothetical protein
MTKTEPTTWRFYLRPLDRVQFGKERDPDRQDYYVASRPWPQQSALLGLLRYLLLRQNGLLLGTEKGTWDKGAELDRVHDLIGPTSFTGDPDTSYGILRSVGPLSIWRKEDDRHFFPCMDLQHGMAELTATAMQAGHGAKDFGLAHDFTDFDAKDPAELLLTDLEGGTAALMDKGTGAHGRSHMDRQGEGVFFKFTTPGVVKTYAGDKEREDKAGHFYVTESYVMRRGFGFSFTASFASLPSGSTEPNWGAQRLVRFGSDGHPWSIQAKKLSGSTAKKETTEGSQFLLLTDARVDSELFNHCRAVVGDVQHFRNQRKSTRTTWAHHATHSVQEEQASERLQYEPSGLLLKRGTVLWAKKGSEDKVEEALQGYQAFRTIGYNQWHRFEKAGDIMNTSNKKEE